jgi:hypothetical protein
MSQSTLVFAAKRHWPIAVFRRSLLVLALAVLATYASAWLAVLVSKPHSTRASEWYDPLPGNDRIRVDGHEYDMRKFSMGPGVRRRDGARVETEVMEELVRAASESDSSIASGDAGMTTRHRSRVLSGLEYDGSHLVVFSLSEIEAGWPVRALRERTWFSMEADFSSREFPERTDGWKVHAVGESGRPVTLPLIPVWPGFALNVLVLSAIIASAWYIPVACVRAWRRARGLCVGCAYDMKASANICPECGLHGEGRRLPEAVVASEGSFTATIREVR